MRDFDLRWLLSSRTFFGVIVLRGVGLKGDTLADYFLPERGETLGDVDGLA